MQFDLKRANIYFVDGYTNTGLVNRVGNFAIGATTILMDGHTGIITPGTTFTVAGDVTTYTVASHVETLGNTTSITFTPPLVVAANDNAVITFAKTDSGAVNLLAGYFGGETTIVVDGFTGIIPVGSVVTIGTDPGAHVVTSTLQTLGNTTSITFTIALAGVVDDDDVVSYVYSGTGAVNKVGTYAIGTSTMLIDGVSEQIPLGTTFRMENDVADTIYSVTSTIETLGATTSITFTPPLVEAVTDNDDVTFSGRRLLIKVGDGTMSYDEKKNREYKKDRGRIDTVRDGDEEPMDVKLDIRWEFLRSDTTDPTSIPSPEDVLKQRGEASDWESTSDDVCEPYCIDIEVYFTPPCEDIKPELITLREFRYEQLSHDFKQGTLSCSGKCNVTVADVVRLAV